MAKKKNQFSNENDGDNGGGGDGDGGKKQKASDNNKVVLKIDLHCEGCAGRVIKAVRTLDGVESVRIGDSELNKLTVIGDLDPVKLRQMVEEKTKKKVEVISPAVKKTDGGGEGKKKQQQPPEKEHKPPLDNAKTAGKNDHKKPKEIPVTTGVLKVPLHCQGCIRKIHKLVTKTKGYMDLTFDKNKDLVTVKGAIDVKLLAEALQEKLKRAVEVVPSKKDGDEKKGDGGDKKGKNGGGNDGEGKNGGEKKGKNKGGEGNGGDGGDGGKPELYRMENYGGMMVYPYPQYAYGPGFVDYVHAPQLFSDENPNACVVM